MMKGIHEMPRKMMMIIKRGNGLHGGINFRLEFHGCSAVLNIINDVMGWIYAIARFCYWKMIDLWSSKALWELWGRGRPLESSG